MNKKIRINLSGLNRNTKIFWWVMVAAALFALSFAAFRLISFSVLQLITLGTALIISVIISQHQIRLPRTRITFSAKEMVILWGTIWLGVAGGVLLAASVYLTRFNGAPKNKQRWIFTTSLNIFASFIAAKIFYLTLTGLTGFSGTTLADTRIGFGSLILAMSLTALAHYVSTFVLTSIFIVLEKDQRISDQLEENFVSMVVGYILGVSATVLFHLAFLTFELPFGLVILVVSIVGHSAYTIHVKSLDQKTKEIKEASRIHLATVEALATAIDARDQVGLGHVRRTQIFAIGVGEILNLPEDDICALRTGALLHDIGKLAVPDHILNKPGRLTSAEMEKMKIHATVGASILAKVGFTYPVVPTVKYHHEMWDGTGYPEGRIGEDIPLTARILAVADAYDTLRSARPFRSAIPREEARKSLLNGSGTRFDPKIVDVFLRNLRRLEEDIEAEGLSYNEDSKNEFSYFSNETEDHGYIQQIKRANREVFTLYELARDFSSSLNLDETLSLFVKKIGELIPYDTCVVYLMDNSQETAKAVYVEGKNSSELKNKRIQAGEGATGFVLKKRQPIHEIEPELDFMFDNVDFSQDYTAMVSLPLIAEEHLIGAVSLYSCDLNSYEEEHLRLLETISRIAADVISKSLEYTATETRALTDPMTNLPNARSLHIQFEKEVARANRNGNEFQVLMLDLDGFKAVNDTFGHKIGDDMLRQIAEVLRGQLRDYDFLARYAGDEFVAIVPETNGEAVRELCSRMEKAVKEIAVPTEDGKTAKVGISIGAASFPKQGETLDQILVAADKEMYSVKALHKQIKVAPLPVEEFLPKPEFIQAETVVEDSFIVEVDESHIISSAIN